MSSAIIKNSLTGLKSFLQDYQASFTSGLLILFTVCAEQIFKEAAFKCPCEHSVSYVCAFVFAPFGILLLLGIVISNLFWRLCHGCWDRTKDVAVKKYSNGFRTWNRNFCKVLAKGFVVPLAWLFMVSLDGNYYACAMAGKPCNKEMKKPCNQTTSMNETTVEPCHETKVYDYYRAESQFWGWIGLLVLVGAAVVVICIVRCCDSVTYEQNKFILSYREAEQQKLDTAIQKYTNELAEKNVESFMKKNRSKEDWDFISKTPGRKVEENSKNNIFLTDLNFLVKEEAQNTTTTIV